MGAIIWMGPVSTSNLASVALPAGWSIVTVSLEVVAPDKTPQEGLTPTDFRNFASTLGSDPLGALMARAQGGAPDVAILASFSAGHGLLDPVLQANAGDPRLVGVYAADSYYGLDVKPGYLKQGQASMASGVPFWLSTSNAKGGVTIHSGSESAKALADALALPVAVPPPGMPAPVACRGSGGTLWLDYQGLYAHAEHATKLCPQALNLWLSTGAPPAVSPGSLSAPDQGPGGATLAMATAAGAAIGFFAAKYLIG